ncbi:MAG TPA: hypothetical protein VFJ99_05670 [Solirubrobacterales bacterium]|nr:hypothetical protein [Solirubrobacterales bacterium]
MRDRLLNEALRRLAAEAATRFTTLVASGDQIPFDVAESAGPDDTFFHSYVPLTARYVREREDELRTLPAFEPAREAVALADVAAPYLEQRGEHVPAEPGERAARLLTVFLAGLWNGSSEFSLDRERLEEALAVLDAEAGDADEAETVVVPLVGFQMAGRRLGLPHGMQIVRADSFEAPVEAMRSEGMGRAAWEPQFLAVAEQGEGSESAAEALHQLDELVSVMRLYKGGGVGLGPHAFAPTGEGRWRRIPTGAPAPREGGYRLSDEETAELVELAETLEARPDPVGPLAWAVRRFELGCERPTPLEGLSDHLLALRAVLDGQGPVGASLPMRAAALIADGSTDRLVARERLERAMELERVQMAGAPGDSSSAGLAGWIEESVRRIMRDAALGELGADLNEAADETLIATGLDTGDVAIAVAEEIEPDPEPVSAFDHAPARKKAETADLDPTSEEDLHMDQDTRILEPVPAEDEIRITDARDWLDEVEEDERAPVEESTLNFPAVADDLARRERIDTPRVRHLFPVPEDADWQVRELDYDHYNRHTG